jgi:hypothetical protein
VLLIPELLETIISFLPTVEILTHAQLVSRTWNTAAASPIVQDKLWRRKGKTPLLTQIRIASEWADDSPEDAGMPIYTTPIVLNSLFGLKRHLHRDCVITAFLRI